MNKLTIEKHGNGYALYAGRDNQHHGLNIFNITEADPKLFEYTKNLIECSNPMLETLSSLELKIESLDLDTKKRFKDELDTIKNIKAKIFNL